jgi:hypothetical protein
MSVVLGVLGWGTLRRWWLRLWKPVPRRDGEIRLGFIARRLPGELLFWLAFMPVAGGPAFIAQSAINLWAQVTAPFRWFRRKFLTRDV